MQISTKQNQIAQAIRGKKKKVIILTGALGTSKTFGAAVMLLSLAKQYPKSVIGVGRKNTVEMKRGTLLSFQEAAEKMNLVDYHENRQDMFWLLSNGSRIQFFEIDQSHDREFSKIKSMNLTCAFIDEADAIQKEGFLATYGRVGRQNENGAPDFMLLACNPNESWIKEDYYDNKDKLQEDTQLIEFEMMDSFLPKGYYEKFENAPINWKKRYLYNDWSYADDDNSLFKYTYLDRSHITVLKDDTKYSALDVARFGKDRSVASIWQGKQLIDIKILKEKEDKITNTELARKYINYCKENGVGYENACVDAVGNGSGVVDYCHEKGFYVKEYLAGGKSDGNYKNRRSQDTHRLAQDFEKYQVKVLDSCPYISELKKELTMQNYVIEDKQLIVESKDKIKERLGMSPDIADCVVMGYSMIEGGGLGLDDIYL